MTSRSTRGIVVLLFVLLLALTPAAAETPVLTILHFNDDYQLTAVDNGKAGGLDRLASVVGDYRRRAQPTLVLFAGDLISPSVESSVFKGAQLIDGLNLLGVDAAGFGNHEFDYGPAELTKRVSESRFPWVASNAFTPGFRLFPGTHSYLTLTAGGARVGIIGLVTEETATASSPGNTMFGDPVTVARVLTPVLRRNGAQVIIALTHLTVASDQDLLRQIPEIDLVIGGHDHDPLTARVDGRLIAKAGSDARWLGVTRLALDGSRTAAHDLIPITDQTPADPALAALVKRYSSQLSRELDVVIGETTVELDARTTVVRQLESALGNFIADVMRTAVQADLAMINGGGIRTNAVFPAGRITRKDVFAWLPFGNVVVKIAVPGSAIRQALENGVSDWDRMGGRFPQISGLRYTFNPARLVGARILDVRVGDQPLDEARVYTMATNDFMGRGGDGYSMLAAGQLLVTPAEGPLMATAVMDAIQRARIISPRLEARIAIAR